MGAVSTAAFNETWGNKGFSPMPLSFLGEIATRCGPRLRSVPDALSVRAAFTFLLKKNVDSVFCREPGRHSAQMSEPMFVPSHEPARKGRRPPGYRYLSGQSSIRKHAFSS